MDCLHVYRTTRRGKKMHSAQRCWSSEWTANKKNIDPRSKREKRWDAYTVRYLEWLERFSKCEVIWFLTISYSFIESEWNANKLMVSIENSRSKTRLYYVLHFASNHIDVHFRKPWKTINATKKSKVSVGAVIERCF